MDIGRRKITMLLVSAFTICGGYTSTSFCQKATTRIEPPAVIEYNGDMAAMLMHLTEIYQTTIGFEVDSQQPNSRVGFYLRDPSLPDVLNAMVQSAPRYRWRENGQFIEVSPTEGSCQLLDIIINEFSVTDVDAAESIDYLLKLNEVQASARAMGLNRRNETAAEKKGDRFSLKLESVTMRQALNNIAKMSGNRFWILRRDSNGSFSISTSLR